MYVIRLGEHTGVQANARVNFTPAFASASMWGVTNSLHPYVPVAHGAWSSVIKTIRFGRRRGARLANAGGRAAKNSRRVIKGKRGRP
jgi:hypothetical protein